MHKDAQVDASARRGMAEVARFHREHERFHSLHGLERAVELRQESNKLKILADRWFAAAAPGSDASGNGAPAGAAFDASDPRFRAAGCADLNQRGAIAAIGVLFMEGESEPRELVDLRRRLRSYADEYVQSSAWLSEKMDAGWKREQALLSPDYAHLAGTRFAVLTRTTMSAATMSVVGRLLGAAAETIEAMDLRPEAVRVDLGGNAALLRSLSWIVDHAAALLARQGAELGLSDPDWTRYLEALDAGIAEG